MTQVNEEFGTSGKPDNTLIPFIVMAERQDGGQDIEIRNMTVKTPGENGRTLVKNLNLTLKKGSRVVLTGASGSGKTLTAKALLNQWDYGSGVVVMPKGIKIMSMSQQTYFSNTTMRGMLNITPDDKPRFDDSDLTRALQAVGHDHLVQHIPGQQVEIMMKDLLQKLPETFAKYAGESLTPELAGKIREDVAPIISNLIKTQFSTVQYVPQKQRDFLHRQLKVAVKGLRRDVYLPQLETLTDGLCFDIDIALVQPLVKHLARTVPEWASKKRGKIFAYTPAKASYFARSFEKGFSSRLAKYMANEDTDDLARDIRINKEQAAYVTWAVSKKMHEEFSVYARVVDRPSDDGINAVPNIAGLDIDILNETLGFKQNKGGRLNQTFNAVTWPVSLVTVRSKAQSVAHNLMQRAAFFMDRQIVRGETLTLSGGERQKLIIAMVLLHKPDILILDEITAALDPQTGAKLYKEMLEQIPPGTTLLSIAHNEYIKSCHTHHAHLENQTITMREIQEKNIKMDNICSACPLSPVSKGPDF